MSNIQNILNAIEKTARKTNFCGFDPYDGLYLNSLIGKILKSNKFGRLALIHFNKRSIINFRPLLGVRKALNPKAAALFLSGFVKLDKLDEANRLKERLLNNRISGCKGNAWGYYFPWQSRVFYLPANTPNAVVTCFVAHAFMDLYEKTGESNLLTIVEGVIQFITEELNRFKDESGLCFSYSPHDHSLIYNASAFCLEVLARFSHLTQSSTPEIEPVVEPSLNFIINDQNNDGSWYYGKQFVQHFIDHYHTAYLLESLENINEYTNNRFKLRPVIERGIEFYQKNLFTESFLPKFYKNAIYPIESHCVGATIKALCRLSDNYGRHLYDLALKVADVSIENLFDPKRGYFYYQKRKFWTNKINYLRWSQAWMFIGLTSLLTKGKKYEYSFHQNSWRAS